METGVAINLYMFMMILDTNGKVFDPIYLRSWSFISKKTYTLRGLRTFMISMNMQRGDTSDSVLS